MMNPKGAGAYAAVVGGVNMDIGGMPFAPLRGHDSNPGSVRTAVGGVGQNIARNLALLKVPVHFLTAYGWDENGSAVERACEGAGIDLSSALRLRDAPTSVYLYVSDEMGEMQVAISDMAICERITPEYLQQHEALLNGAGAVVLDANIPEESVQWLSSHVSAPLFADPVSMAKAEKLRPVAGRLHTIKPNRLEAELLSGVKIRNESDLAEAANALLSRGLSQVHISLGGRGVYAADQQEQLRLPIFPVDARNMTGAGDAYLAGLVYSYLNGYPLRDAARFASAAAAVAVQGEGTVNEDMCPEAVFQVMGGSPGSLRSQSGE